MSIAVAFIATNESFLHKERMSLRTDALPNGDTKSFAKSKIINKEIWEKVEQDLEEFEKISILFLMVADYPEAYEKILKGCKNVSDIVGELLKLDVRSWSEKLLEALCIINNREILKNLGFEPADIVQRYYQNIGLCTVVVHPMSKVLYKLFETMDTEKAKIFLRYIYQDEIENYFKDLCYLELHALHWLHAKYITISSDKGGDLSKLLKHLKRMDYGNELIYQDVEHFSTKSSGIDHRLMDESASDKRSTILEKTIDSMKNTGQHLMEKYEIKKGKCVIINEENFSRKCKSEYEKREGTRKDSERLRKTFTGLGFDVEEHMDLSEKEMLQELTRVSQNFNKKVYDCLVVTILSHGVQGGIVSSDGEEISLKIIEDVVCSENLQNIIKVLIIQACQGKKTGDVSQNSGLTLDGPSSGISGRNIENILRFGNYARFMSTMEGFNSIRHKEDGSWFIRAICDVLHDSKNISISQWSTSVTKKVRSNVGYVNDCPKASQIPEFFSRLETEVYFPSYRENLSIINEEPH